jgi:hypothetical protein
MHSPVNWVRFVFVVPRCFPYFRRLFQSVVLLCPVQYCTTVVTPTLEKLMGGLELEVG